MHYSPAEREELEAIAKRLMDADNLGHAERMIVDAVIQDCEEKGEDLSERLKNFLREGLSDPH